MKILKKILYGKNFYLISLSVLILITTILKLILVFFSSNSLSVYSDDINYYMSAVYLIKNGVLTYRDFNEATVFIMPLYPFFLGGVLGIFGIGFSGLQAVRIVQVILSALCILLIYSMGKRLFSQRAGLISAVIFSFYPPNLVTPLYILTECLFTFLLILLLHLSFKFAGNIGFWKAAILGSVWTLAVLCRPTILFFPVFYLAYLYANRLIRVKEALKYGIIMITIFTIAFFPWWFRNYNEYSKFIPLTASSGNPMLQGSYINYHQTHENATVYRMGNNSFETDNIELDIAKQRTRSGFKNHFFSYLMWYTLGKTIYFWAFPFYWSNVFGIEYYRVFIYHFTILITASAAIFKLIRHNLFLKYSLIVIIALYFNAIHCVYMSFDRYAYPIIALVSVYSGAAFTGQK